MEHVYESIMTGLAGAIEDAQSKEKHLQRRIAAVMPVKTYNAKEDRIIAKTVCWLYGSFTQNGRSLGSRDKPPFRNSKPYFEYDGNGR